MANLFGNIYYMFVNLFGQHLSDYLWGYNCATQAFDSAVVYLPVGLSMTGLTLLVCLVYYFVLNHPRWNKWWHWLITNAATAGLNILIGGIMVGEHLQSGRIPDCLRIEVLADGSVIEHITMENCWLFGLANGIVAFILFCIVSMIVKRWSLNCKHTPFTSKFPNRNK